MSQRGETALTYRARARIADNLYLSRLRGGYSWASLSRRAMVSAQRIAALEDGEVRGRLDTYVRLAGSLSVPLDDLLAGVVWTPAVVERQVEAGYRVVFEVDDSADDGA